MLQGDLIVTFQHPKELTKKMERGFRRAWSARARGNGFTLTEV